MSLISDALQAAQRERERRTTAAAPSRRAMLDGFFSIDRKRHDEGRRRLLIGVAGVTVVTIVLVTVAFNLPWDAASGQKLSDAGADAPTAPAEGAAETQSASLPEVGPQPPAPQPQSQVAAVTTSQETGDRTEPADRQDVGSRQTSQQPPRPQPVVQETRPPQTETQAAGPPATPSATQRGGVQMRIDAAAAPSFEELFANGLAAQNRGDLLKARELYEQLLLVRPQWAQAHNNLGAVYRGLGDTQRAEASFRRAIQLDDAFPAAWSNLGMLLSASGNRSEGVAALQHALQLDPASVGTKVNLAIELHATGMRAEAKALLQDALATAPNFAQAHYALARLLDEAGERDLAVRHYNLFLLHGRARFPEFEKLVRERLAALEGDS